MKFKVPREPHGIEEKKDTEQRDKLGKGGWTEEQEDELRNLYMENQTNPQTDQDPMGKIIPRMPRCIQKQHFNERLLELDLIEVKKQCRYNRNKNFKPILMFIMAAAIENQRRSL